MMQLAAPSDIPNKFVPPINIAHIKDEKGVKQIVKGLLNAYGWFTWMPPMNGFGAQGVHDHAAIKDGVYLTVEAKFGTRKPTPLQRGFAAQIMANDGFSFLVSERNIDHLAWWLESFQAAVVCQMQRVEVPAEHGSRMLNAISVLTDGWAE